MDSIGFYCYSNVYSNVCCPAELDLTTKYTSILFCTDDTRKIFKNAFKRGRLLSKMF